MRQTNQGYTLVELLIAAVLGLTVLMAVLQVIDSHVRSRTVMEALMRLQDQWSRVQFLMNADIEEGRPVAAGVSSGLCSTGSTVFTRERPEFSTRIRYYVTGTELRRCGPTIDRDGQLVDVSSDALVVRGVSNLSVDLSDPQRPTFRFTLTDSSGTRYANSDKPSGETSRSRDIN